ncbi:glycoside hydrolase family 2 protein [Paraflavisolibacter caeni]|uniref:glycoside hydrolase family 2 protein n=1 Tax=Paraflavisolibacter caeni TaxID=2982496 RepID=UPI002433CE97|nr:sugar-binding domain-containing protein [Paraflavisolibacter caeni]
MLSFISLNVSAQQGRIVKNISGNNWKLWLDTAAQWKNDVLYTPPVAIQKLPVNKPTGGWAALQSANGKMVHLPATVEEFYWGNNGNPFGVSGNYLGVSWFTTKVALPATLKGKRITLQFESVRFRAEVFVNQKLVGYDLVNSTPFEVDITDAVVYGKENEVAVRITDPNGNFDWRDSQNFMWGAYRTQPTHGFGGITGKVQLVATDKAYISDIFVKNKPKENEVDVAVTTENVSGQPVNGALLIQIKEAKGAQKMVFQKQYSVQNVADGSNTQTFTIALNDAKLWSVDDPNLYVLTATLKSGSSIDTLNKRFGFRWFEVRDVAGDKQYYLNGNRIVLRTSISWGFWPINGITPSDKLAKKQIMVAKSIGLNMLNFHRTIGQQIVLDYADELGLLYFEEPGGNQYPADRFNATDSLGKMQASYYFTVRNEKLFRMIRRDRNHPSLVIYNMHNERGAQPQEQDRQQMLAAHKLDETRIITYNSSNGDIKMGPDPRFKLHLLPYDFTFRDYGWFDQHHAGGPGTYHDNLYSSPTKYLRYTDHKDEIIYYGEEGAIGAPPRLELIRDDILKRGKDIGWESDAYLKWYEAYDNFLKTKGFSKAFPSVDALTKAMGNVAYYYQGRAIENIRINNIVDGYAVNGWESMKLENHSGIVDNYRNPKGDVNLIARYNQPLYVAVKMNRKVLAIGDTTVVDLFIVNEKDVKGDFELNVKATDGGGKVVWSKTVPVKVSGGIKYGELLTQGLMFVPSSEGYTTITAELKRGNRTVATGDDQLFAVRLDATGVPAMGMVADTSGVLTNFLQSAGVNNFKEFKDGRPEGKYLVVGAFEPQQTGNPLVTEILEWVNEGNTLIVVGNIEKWATFLGRKEVIDYRGLKELGTTWYGGNYFVKQHPLFAGLPQNCVFNWEYQCFATYNKNRLGLRIFNGETIVGCVSDHKQEVYSALSVIPHGRRKVILSALDLFSCLKDVKMEKKAEGDGENAAMTTFNTSQKNAANVVGLQLLLNMLKYAEQAKSLPSPPKADSASAAEPVANKH